MSTEQNKQTIAEFWSRFSAGDAPAALISGSVEQLNILAWGSTGIRGLGAWGMTLFQVIIRT